MADSPECQYQTKACEGSLWKCVGCGAHFCQEHWHASSKGRNLECLACEYRRLDETPPPGTFDRLRAMPPKLTIFIDFDGVFHPLGACSWIDHENQHHFVQAFRWWPEFRDALKPLHKDVELVIHSTWRHQWHLDELKSFLPAEMAAMVVGTTTLEIMSRGASIDEYVARNRIEHFVVVDDEEDAFAPGYAPLVVCNGTTGLSDIEVQAKLYRMVSTKLTALREPQGE